MCWLITLECHQKMDLRERCVTTILTGRFQWPLTASVQFYLPIYSLTLSLQLLLLRLVLTRDFPYSTALCPDSTSLSPDSALICLDSTPISPDSAPNCPDSVAIDPDSTTLWLDSAHSLLTPPHYLTVPHYVLTPSQSVLMHLSLAWMLPSWTCCCSPIPHRPCFLSHCFSLENFPLVFILLLIFLCCLKDPFSCQVWKIDQNTMEFLCFQYI